ncbi:S8 family serine peptidase [Streptomyces sp. NBC_00234]|uniref:S8 family serine peptidase n=1 Tax=Streptomyces sp. NBC_00234 TaxID=2903638 RepID=UPI002E29F9CD|nr:S8 family serine peptidase [Streptomyces sp. NBC_00234]
MAALVIPLLVPVAGGTSFAQQVRDEPVAERKVEPELLGQLQKEKKVTFWVEFGRDADLRAAAKARTKTEKATAVLAAKKQQAKTSQANAVKLLKSAGVDHTSFWINNSLQVVGGKELVDKLAALPEVAQINSDEAIELDTPVAAETEPTVDAVEWNVDRIEAPRVWDEIGVRGEGIVVANIDSGVQYDHPALKKQYRGLKADGTYDHEYNWFDPTQECDVAAPCDTSGHGTHTMGTMVGDDGGTNRVGVAPGAKWISVKACTFKLCNTAPLLAAGQWMIAPTDLRGGNPRPDLAPDVVNNSWGGDGSNPMYQDIVAAWRAAGIFPAFSNGNSGPICNTSGFPGSYVSSYSSGAFDINNEIFLYSSRGSGENGTIKPNLAAPGVNVRSSVTGGGYAPASGTSMASPHTAATVALMWSASPAIQGDVARTEAFLNQTAIDTDNTTCGGTAAKNNVFGEGRLNAYKAVSATPHGPNGALGGTVTSGGEPVAGAKLNVDGPMDRTLDTAADGTFTLPKLPVGDYTLTASKFGYSTDTSSVTITQGQTTTRDFTLEQAPSVKVSGTVTSRAGPAAGATITVKNTPVTATANAQGHYEVALPLGTYDVTASPRIRCAAVGTAHVDVTADATADISLADRTDAFGYACQGADNTEYVAGTDKTTLTGDSEYLPITLPFQVPFYGRTYASGWISTNGALSFDAPSSATNVNSAIPHPYRLNAALYPFWDDLIVNANTGGVYTGVIGTAPHRSFVVEWRNVTQWSAQFERFSFSAVIGEDGKISYHYKDITGVGVESGSSATIGVENASGTDALQYSYDTPGALSDGFSLDFRTSKSGVVQGKVLDANDGEAIEGATVTVGTGDTAMTGETRADGSYLFQAPSGATSISLTAPAYQPFEQAVTLDAGDVVTMSEALKTGKVSVATKAYDFLLPADEPRTSAFELANSGSSAAYTVVEDAPWLTVSLTGGELAAGAKATGTLTVDPAGHAGEVLTTTVQVKSDSGRAPVISVPVKVVVPEYQAAVDAGASNTAVDTFGDTWQPDRKYLAGAFGYEGTSSVRSTTKAIAGTDDPKLFQDAREGMYGYRFDNVPDGVYTVELDFAELSSSKPGQRVFDVLAEDIKVLPSLDITREAGTYAAVTRTYTVAVTDGVLNVRFVATSGKPQINAIRVTERPDKA